MRTCSPTASVTGRPEACTSWAIWIPLADGPDHQHPALREVGGAAVGGQVRCGPARRPLLDPRGHAVAERGHGGMLAPPAATTTVRARHVSWSVSTTYPSSARRTAVTVVLAWTGAADSFA